MRLLLRLRPLVILTQVVHRLEATSISNMATEASGPHGTAIGTRHDQAFHHVGHSNGLRLLAFLRSRLLWPEDTDQILPDVFGVGGGSCRALAAVALVVAEWSRWDTAEDDLEITAGIRLGQKLF